jgi:subtilisin-like proprotein convertase family protein
MNKIFSLLFFLLIAINVKAQDKHDIVPANLSEIEKISMPFLDNVALAQKELISRNTERAPRFAESIEVDISPDKDGTWESQENGDLIWRIYIESPGARSLNFGFNEYQLPKGASLILYAPESFEKAGPFTNKDNEVHEEMWSPIVEADGVVIQLIVPAKNKSKVKLRLSTVNHDFLGFRSVVSGACNVDVVCGEEDGPQFELIEDYRDIIQSVGLLTLSGSAFCTGFLVNNVRQDQTPYYMTANHCGVNGGNASSVVVYWNFENSYCRAPGSGASGGPGDGERNQFNSGAFWRASYSPSDVTLIELDDPVNEDADAFFAGWTNLDAIPPDTLIAIHHPSLDEKRISFEFDTPHLGTWANGGANIPDGDHIIIPDWDVGTTEGGSSGSPLFNKNRRVVGQLHGGQASCNNNSYDSYGWFHTSWEGGGNSTNRLKDWLDPDDTGIVTLGGLGESIVLPVDQNNLKICKPDSLSFNIEIPVLFSMPVNLTMEDIPNGSSVMFSENPVTPGSIVTATFSGLSTLTPNSYSSTLLANDGNDSTFLELKFTIIGDLNLLPSLVTPINLSEDQNLNPNFSWTILGGDDLTHQIQVALDPDFENIVLDEEGISVNDFTAHGLNNETTYYWRVRSTNLCGPGPWSGTFAFKTGNISCLELLADDTPVTIVSAGTPTINSNKDVIDQGPISQFTSLSINIVHSYIGDLEAKLISPKGTEIMLFDRPGFPLNEFGCDGENLNIVFSDNAENSAEDFENTCGSQTPSISGEYKPMQALSTFNGEDMNGNWVLSITDNENQDGGQLVEWEMNICSGAQDVLAVAINPGDIEVCDGVETPFQVTIGEGFEASGATLTAENLVDGLFVNFESNPVSPGSTTNGTVSAVDLPDGDYTFDLVVNDGINLKSNQVRVELKSSPVKANLIGPGDLENDLDINPIFAWDMEPNVGNYILEVSKDENFATLSYTVGLISSPFELLDIDLDYETNYFWRIIAVNECGTTSSVTRRFTTSKSSSTSDVDLDQILVYPNPSNGLLIVDLGDTRTDITDINVYNTTGLRIFSKAVSNSTQKILMDLGHLRNGTYFIQLKSTRLAVNKKFVILR